MNLGITTARVRAALLASSALVVAVPGLAVAQSVPPASQAASSSMSAPALGEVVVTAERHESTVQKTAATIAVVNSKTLQRQNITQLTDLNDVLLDTQMVPVLNAVQPDIRGIGSNFVDPRADPAVAISVNGLFYDRALPVGFAFLDVSRVEVLEGPQGTLYGRNSAAGAINIITNQPTNQFGAVVNVTAGNLDENDINAVLNLPASDSLAFRLAYDRDRRDGYLGGYYDDVHSDTGKISARWTPTNKLTVYAEGSFVQFGGNGVGATSWACGGGNPWSTTIPASCALLGPGGQPPNTETNRSWVLSGQLHIDYDFGPVVLTSISGYVGTHDRNYNLPNGTLFNQGNLTDSNDWSEELRLAGHDNANHAGGLAWQVGTYLFDSTGDYVDTQAPFPAGNPLYLGSPVLFKALTKVETFSAIPQSSQSGYAQLSYGITDELQITGGVRYSHDFKGVTYSQYGYPTPVSASEAIVAAGTTSSSGDQFTYKAGIQYSPTKANLLYANISTGYVAGGVNGGNPAVPLTANTSPAVFLPETITAYEVGSKNRFLDNRLQINGDFYYYQFHNFQYLYPAFVQGGGTVSNLEIQNAAAVTAYGVELSAEFALTPDDRFSASVGWSHAAFGKLSFAGASGATAITVSVPPGSAVPNSPEWTGLFGYEHTFHLNSGAFITASANTKISSPYQLVVASTDPYDTQKGYAMTDASLAYHWPSDKYEVQVWVKNLENVPVDIYGEGAKFHLYGIEPPRTFGVTLSARF